MQQRIEDELIFAKGHLISKKEYDDVIKAMLDMREELGIKTKRTLLVKKHP